jgi:uncharacterized protein (DUF4415 family)
MSAKSLKRKSQTNWEKVDNLSDKEIDTSDIGQLDEKFFKNTEISLRPPKKSLTLRLDADVLEWFRKMGEGYQTRINAILRTYMKAHSK